MNGKIWTGLPSRLLLWKGFLATSLIFCLLQYWRPCYFLTDDNLSGGLPFLTEMGRNLWKGRSPFISECIFGGNYNLLRDPTFFSWHPLNFVISLLTLTPARFFVVDILVFINLLISVAGFILLADYLRRNLGVPISDARILFLTLSLNFSLYVLMIASSWESFMSNYAVLPWLMLGLLHHSGKIGTALIAFWTLHEILGGHLEPTISTFVIFSLLALGLSMTERTWRPVLVWGLGNACVLILLFPLLWTVWNGFNGSVRAGGISLYDMNRYNIDISLFPFSFFFGAWLHFVPFVYPPNAFSGLFACASAWYFLPVLLSPARWTALQGLCLALVLFLAVLIYRPFWISELMRQLPLFKSMRWPFREAMQCLFFLHLLFVLRTPGGTLFFQRGCLVLGCILFIVPLLFLPPPTINPLRLDRQLLLSGQATAYWNRVRPLFQPGDRYVVLEEMNTRFSSKIGVPNILLGSHNYAMLFQLPNDTGYSATPPIRQIPLKDLHFWFWGAYIQAQKEDILRLQPKIKFITLESIQPLKITFVSPGSPPTDLTPYLNDPPRRP